MVSFLETSNDVLKGEIMLSPEGITNLIQHALHCVNDDVMIDIGVQANAMKMTCDSCPVLACSHCIDDCPYPDAWPTLAVVKTDMGIVVMVESYVIGHTKDKGKFAGYIRVYENNIQVGQQPIIITLPISH
jgi:hypothetical protein